jgi:hypothetical protein
VTILAATAGLLDVLGFGFGLAAIVSLNATSGFPTLASTLNSRSRRSTMISGATRPSGNNGPAVSSSVRTRNDGSSWASF